MCAADALRTQSASVLCGCLHSAHSVKAAHCLQGGAAITLLDSLDALLIFGQEEDFRAAVPLVEAVDFARNATVDVFEITIRYVPRALPTQAQWSCARPLRYDHDSLVCWDPT